MAVATIDNIGSGGIELEDINPDKVSSGFIAGYLCVGGTSGNGKETYIPINGYKKLALIRTDTGGTLSFSWCYKDGTKSASIATITSSWSDYYDIPDDASCVVIKTVYTSQTYFNTYYSLLTDKQVIPTKVNGDVNPGKVMTDDFKYKITADYSSIPVSGYSKISFTRGSVITFTYRFLLADGTYSTESTFTTVANTWRSINIPTNALLIQAKFTSSSYFDLWYALEI